MNVAEVKQKRFS